MCVSLKAVALVSGVHKIPQDRCCFRVNPPSIRATTALSGARPYVCWEVSCCVSTKSSRDDLFLPTLHRNHHCKYYTTVQCCVKKKTISA